MAITLYDRSEAGDSMLSEDGGRLLRSAVTAIRCFLAEAEADGPVDLRDLQSIIHSATDDVVLNAIITRRLSVRRKRPIPRGWMGRGKAGVVLPRPSRKGLDFANTKKKKIRCTIVVFGVANRKKENN